MQAEAQTDSTSQTSNADKASTERIIVTGSRRNDRTVSESTVPIDIIRVEDMVSTGQLEMSQVLSTLVPSFNYPQATITDGTDHARPAVLRGLAPDHTLVLINGKRRHSSALLNLNGSVGRGSSAVDLNNIPTSAIKSIEILRDGAAAQYGSDAIAGVINIILKDGEGGNLSATYGKYDSQMAGVPQLTNIDIDANGNLVFTTGDDRRVNDGAISTIAGNYGLAVGDRAFLNLSFESRNRQPTNRSGFDPRENYARDANGDLDDRELTFDRYNHRFGKADIEDMALFYNFGWDLANDLKIYSFGSYAEREGLSGGFYRRANDSRNVPSIYPDGFLPKIGSDVQDHSLTLGLKGETSDWNWDLSVVRGKNDFAFSVHDSLNTSLGASSPTDFENGSLIYAQTVANFTADTAVDWGFEEEVFVFLGAEYRHENYEITQGEEASYITMLDANGNPVGPGGAQVLSGFSPESVVDRSRHNVALFVEFDTNLSPVFNMALAGRYEDYSDFGSTFTSKLAARYAVTDNFALRGAISTGFRAPSLAQTSYKSIATVFENGIPREVGHFPVDDPAAITLGATTLEAEESVNGTFGFVYELDAFNLTLDAYHIEIEDRIVLSENLQGPAVVAILQAAGELNVQSARYFTNAIDTETQGIDVVATYDADLDDFGEISLSMALNFNDTEVTKLKENPPELQSLGDSYQVFADREIKRFEQGTPKNKYNLAAIYSLEDLSVTLRATRYGEVVDPGSTADTDEVLAAKWITDLDVGYQLTEQLSIAVGANNLFDQYPQDTVSNIGNSTFNQIFPYSGFSSYGIDGRFIYARIAYSF
ncbi:TonB-dependent receptor [Aliiglaciecola sp. CAU 1673]|uniref:TonB-dependent receptor plug domain-containing protein n=1 Tax=Aliiglaciecola sp. CAU 1673 TaxID=3032595 RepID=UPI0023D9CB48|nr:TonB-dependent receptor [Aliiglaciecola sp. CAU 1673]MDF2180215.1 TonB-dependent receptor [Aliiglaciecola sp. CAU 1673]